MAGDVLPSVFGKLCHELKYVQRQSPTEYSAECPRCGGAAHDNGEWPDRCRFFIDDGSSPRLWCRRCGYFAWADQVGGGQKPTAADLEKWRRAQIAREEERRRSAERALALLRDERRWARYHDEMTDEARALWRGRGIPDMYIDWWQLGFCERFEGRYKGHPFCSPSLTIPLFDRGWQALNVKHRILNPPEPGQRYRYELFGQKSPVFLANPDEPLDGHVIVVEGEIKAMVVFATLDDARARVVGLPSATPGKDIASAFSEAERVTLVFDPGSRDSGIAFAQAVGQEKCRLLIPPMKVDDGILVAGLGKREVLTLLRSARPVKGYF